VPATLDKEITVAKTSHLFILFESPQMQGGNLGNNCRAPRKKWGIVYQGVPGGSTVPPLAGSHLVLLD
jgi:hypothetical protein